ncbi:MAG: hypothetical protein KGJ36_01965, partial [Acidobacteriota bacterium]|nr:hypothetical protein [Acidobacteriota bacterium]
LGVWSELVSDGVMHLERAGALDSSRPVVATFLFGSPELYSWADDNPRLVMRRTETVNDPAQIATRPAMLSINTALQIDLYAQANASYVAGSIYSGFGGQPDFVSGALHSPGGQAVIAMRSWHDKSDTSNVVASLDAPVCSFQHSVVVTENGLAHIFGRSQFAQARLLIEEAAHPRARRVQGPRPLQVHYPVAHELGPHAQVALVSQLGRRGVGQLADPHLQRPAVAGQGGDRLADRQRRVVEPAGRR